MLLLSLVLLLLLLSVRKLKPSPRHCRCRNGCVARRTQSRGFLAPVDAVRIEFATPYSSWSVIAASAPNGPSGGCFAWTVPPSAYLSAYTYIRITSASETTASKQSDYFSVVGSEAKVTALVSPAPGVR